MYDRAPRNFTFQSSVGTLLDIGPGTYQHNSTIRSKNEGYAPFQSLSTRDFFLTNESAQYQPSPAQYEVMYLKDKIKGGSTLSNKDNRFKNSKSDVPGPGNYCIEDTIKCTSNVSLHKRMNMEENKKIRFKRGEVPASIPNSKTAYGYEEGPFGTLIKQKPPPIDNSLGPAFYDPKVTNTQATDRYKGCFWSNDTSKRSDFGGRKGMPGPGEYEPFNDSWHTSGVKAESLTTHGPESAPVMRRFIDQLQSQAIKSHVPGPGSYSYGASIECVKPVYNEEGEKIEHPPFGVQTKRFLNRGNSVPGPGSYNDPRTALTSLKKITGMKRSPFGLTATRFHDKVDVEIPGPQKYAVNQANTPKPCYIAATRKGGFGSTSIRNPDHLKPASDGSDVRSGPDFGGPGPGHYQTTETTSHQAPKFHQPLSSMFASLTNRDYDPVSIAKQDQPDGLSYEVADAYNKSQNRCSHAAPRNKDAKRRQQSFVSAASRFSKGSPLDSGDPNLPGPGSYNFKSYIDSRKGKFYFRDQRFKDKIDDTPGPGYYQLAPEVLNTVVRTTFNSTLGNKDFYNDTLSGNQLDNLPNPAIPPTRQSFQPISEGTIA